MYEWHYLLFWCEYTKCITRISVMFTIGILWSFKFAQSSVFFLLHAVFVCFIYAAVAQPLWLLLLLHAAKYCLLIQSNCDAAAVVAYGFKICIRFFCFMRIFFICLKQQQQQYLNSGYTFITEVLFLFTPICVCVCA